MSFFGGYPYQTQQRRSYPVQPHSHFHPQSPPHLNPFGGSYINLFGGDYPQDHSGLTHPYARSPSQAQVPSTHVPSIDDEERAAIAHLRSIQRRKEVERIIREEAERERAIAELQEREREAAIIARVKQERELAAARARAEQERSYAQLLAQLQAQERQRELTIAHEQKRQARARQLELERYRRQQEQKQQHALLSAALKAREQEAEERRRSCARQCGARRSIPASTVPAPATPVKEQQATPESTGHDLEGLNRLLGSLFGFQLDTETKDEKKSGVSTPAPVPAKTPVVDKKESTTSTPAPETSTKTTTSDADYEGLNRLLGSLFGIQFDPESKKSETPAPVPASSEVPVSEHTKSTAIPASVPVAPKAVETSTKAPSPASVPACASEKRPEFPDAINHLLSNYLGLRVEPESKLGQAVSNQASKVPEGLNELLGQFGLEFVPDQDTSEEAGESTTTSTTTNADVTPAKEAETKVEQPATASCSSSATPAEKSAQRYPFDLSEFLNSQNSLPPFVRDILGNVELAFKEQQGKQEGKQDKGKGVAEGEKKVRVDSAPAPAPATAASTATETAPAPVESTSAPASAPVDVPVEEVDPKKASSESIAKLESIKSEIQLARDSFTFPSTLSFASQSPNSDSAPSLLFNKANKPYHAQNNKLLQLLLQADGVSSNGDREVRRKRKEVVKLVEAELEGLEKKRDEMWREVKERREKVGESSDDESGGSWTTGSVFDHDEPRAVHVEDVTANTESEEITATSAPADVEESQLQSQTSENIESEKPASFAEAVKSDKSDPEPTETNNAESSEAPEPMAKSDEVAVSERKFEKEKEEGYELV